MLKDNKNLNYTHTLFSRSQQGFTIIEVLIVLAIAGLIMVVVFLAVPNLQRSQRNNARKSDANNMLQNLSEYIGNATTAPTATCNNLTSCSWISYNPQQLTSVRYYKTLAAFTTAGAPAPSNIQAFLINGTTCDGLAPSTTASAGQYIIYYGIEGSTKTVCTQGS